MKPFARKLLCLLAALLVFAAVGCGAGGKSNDAPVSQAPAADPAGPVQKDAKGKPRVLPK